MSPFTPSLFGGLPQPVSPDTGPLAERSGQWCFSKLFSLATWPLAGLILGLGWFVWLSPLADAWDVPFHLYFSQEFAQTLAEEGTRPDWDAAIYGGRGTAAFRFYAPGAYLVASGFQYLGWSAATALRATVIAFLLAGAWGLVRWMARLGLADRAPLAVVLFLANPVVSIHLFRVFLFQNICAMALFPWVLEALTRLGREDDQAALAQGALLGSLIAWTHLPAALMMGYLAAGWVLLHRLWGTTRRLAWRNVLLMPLLAAALTAPYLLEALPELDSLHFSSHLEKQQPWAHQSFLDDPLGPAALPPQLDTPPLTFLGLERPNFRLAMRVAVALAVGLALLALTSGRLGRDHPALPAMTCGMIGLGLSFRVSLPLWHWMPGWVSLQYPWRWVWPGTILLIPAMTGWWVPTTGAGSGRPNRLITLTGWSCFAMWVFTALWVQGTAIPLSTDLMDRFLAGEFHYPCEYVPATCHLADCRLPRPISARVGPYHQLQVVASGKARLELRHNSRHEAMFHADLPASGGILIGWTHYDQGWALEHAETGQRISLAPYGPCGQLRAELPGGSGTFRLFRVHSPRRTVGMVLALLAVGFVIRLYWKARSDILPLPSPPYPSA